MDPDRKTLSPDPEALHRQQQSQDETTRLVRQLLLDVGPGAGPVKYTKCLGWARGLWPDDIEPPD